MNTAVLALVNAVAAIVLVVAQYVTFFVSGETIPASAESSASGCSR